MYAYGQNVLREHNAFLAVGLAEVMVDSPTPWPPGGREAAADPEARRCCARRPHRCYHGVQGVVFAINGKEGPVTQPQLRGRN